MNVFAEFQKLIPKYPVSVCIVVGEHADGSTTVQTLDGNYLTVLTQTPGHSAGVKVFVAGGKIVGVAPSLPTYTYTI